MPACRVPNATGPGLPASTGWRPVATLEPPTPPGTGGPAFSAGSGAFATQPHTGQVEPTNCISGLTVSSTRKYLYCLLMGATTLKTSLAWATGKLLLAGLHTIHSSIW